MSTHIIGVGELTRYVKTLLDTDPSLRGLSVRGELSNYKIYPSGHHYFTLKDAEGAVSCVMFRGSASKLRFRPENGMKVTVTGSATLYPANGSFQLNVTGMIPEGAGDLQIAFEQLKARLDAEGLFDRAHKKPLPAYPQRVAVITSGAGAAVHDIIRVLGHRWPMAKILVMPVRVQGVEAPPEIVGAIRYANRYQVADVIITGRGGGSIEDLWAFNDERVARAIYESEIPIVSAVGHEPDVTIADYVADRRAATPSNGAEIVGPDSAELADAIRGVDIRMRQALRKKLDLYTRRLNDLAARPVLTDPSVYLGNLRLKVDMYTNALQSAADRMLSDRQRRYAALSAKLDALSPLKVIGRGYAIAEKDGVPVRDVSAVSAGDEISVIMTGGCLACRVEDIHYGKERTDV